MIIYFFIFASIQPDPDGRSTRSGGGGRGGWGGGPNLYLYDGVHEAGVAEVGEAADPGLTILHLSSVSIATVIPTNINKNIINTSRRIS